MQLNNSFTVPVPVEEAWAALMNLEEVAGCIPGATLQSTNGDEFAGQVKVKMGPVQLTYNGEGRFVVRDESLRRAVIEASGKETKGSGAVKAQTTASLHDSEVGTEVHVTTDLSVTGKAAQFGRGVMEDVSARIFDQFARALANQLAANQVTAPPTAAAVVAAPSTDGPAPSIQLIRHSPEAIDLLSVAGGPIARRLAVPVLLVVVLAAVAILVFG
jgi:carbon monoxide dehydrogenase subunit G